MYTLSYYCMILCEPSHPNPRNPGPTDRPPGDPSLSPRSSVSSCSLPNDYIAPEPEPWSLVDRGT